MKLLTILLCFFPFLIMGQEVKFELFNASKPVFYQDESMILTYKITNNTNRDIAVCDVVVVRDGRGRYVANYSYIKVHGSHTSFPDSLKAPDLISRRWSLDSSTCPIIRPRSWLLVSKTVNDCLASSCSHRANVPFLVAETHLPVGKYSVSAQFNVNDGNTFDLKHELEVKKSEGTFKLLMQEWDNQMQDYRERKTRSYPFEPESIYAFIDTCKNSQVKDRLMTRVPIDLRSKAELQRLLEYTVLIENQDILLHTLIRIAGRTSFYEKNTLHTLGLERIDFYKQIVSKVNLRNSLMAKAFVNYLIGLYKYPLRYSYNSDNSVLLSSQELKDLESLLK